MNVFKGRSFSFCFVEAFQSVLCFQVIFYKGLSTSMYSKFSKKKSSLTPSNYGCVSGGKKYHFFWKILRIY